MFLFERIIGILAFSISLIIITILISRCKAIKSTKKYLILYIILLFLMGYFYLPHSTADLYYIENLTKTNLIYKDFNGIVEMIKNTGHSIFYLYYWIFGKVGNIRLLPACTAALFYTNVFYILYKCCIKFDLSPKSMAKTICFFMAGGQFLEVISGIKCLFAFSIVALCCYKEFVEDKSLIANLPLYLFASLMHDAALIAVGFRLIYLFFQSEKKIIVRFRNVFLFLVFAFIAYKYGSEIILGATDKGQRYLSGNVYSNTWEYIIAVLCNIFMIYSIVLIERIMKADPNMKNKLKKCVNFIIMVLLFDCFFIFEYSIFHRFRTFIMILIIPIVSILFEKCKNKEYDFLKKYYLRFQLFFFLAMGLSLLRGNLSSLKFFEIK